jgi:hypothetical protein
MSNRLFFNHENVNVFSSYAENSYPRISFSDDEDNDIVGDLKKLQAEKRRNIFQHLGGFISNRITRFNHFLRPPPKKNAKVERIAQLIAPLKNDHFSTRQITKIYNYIEKNRKKWELILEHGESTSLYIRHNKKLPCTLSVESTGEIFLILKTIIGDGSFKKIKFALSYDSQELVANAVTRLSDRNFIEVAKAEAKIGKRLKGSPYIVPYFFIEEYPSKSGAYLKQRIIQVYYNAGSLWENLAENVVFTPPQIKKMMRDILLGVQHIHDHEILHRDLKLENIFLHKEHSASGEIIYHACIGDFGLGSKLSKINTISGTIAYIAPEVRSACKLTGENYNNHLKTITYAADLYSVGVLFERFLDSAWINANLPDKIPKFDDAPEDLYFLSTKLQNKKPEKRGTLDEALTLLEAIDWNPFYNPLG